METRFLPVYPSHARTALKFGLRKLGIEALDSFLIPDYLCQSVLQPLDQLGLNYQFFPINDDFSPKWEKLEELVYKDIRGIFMVHYFGQPQDIYRFRDFCDRHKLFLIEDNAHGHSGRVYGQRLGTFGDIGISSPRKIVGTSSGGILYRNSQVDGDWQLGCESEIADYPTSALIENMKIRIKKLHSARWMLNRILQERPNYEDPASFEDPPVDDWRSDEISARKLATIDWKVVAAERRKAWASWSDFAVSVGLQPIWKEPHSESCPWMMPAYAGSFKERNHLLVWSWKHDRGLSPWPSLPKTVIARNGETLQRWKQLICFPLDRQPNL